jgi:predicted enzyme related to lactoylglutathione lyase
MIVVNIDVDDLARGIAFYEAAFGLRLGRRLFDGSVAEMLGAPVPIYLLEKSPRSDAIPGGSAVRDYRRHWTPVHIDFTVEDIDAAVAKAVRAGAKLERGIEGFAWGRLATLGDPFGHGFCLLQFVGNGYDEVAAR